MRTNTPFAVISAENPTWLPDVNAWRTESLRKQLRDDEMVFVPLEGHYNATNEASFLVYLYRGDAGPAFTLLRKLAARWGQESILYVDANRGASLIYLDGSPSLDVGLWQDTNAETARANAAYSYDPTQGRYYITRSA